MNNHTALRQAQKERALRQAQGERAPRTVPREWGSAPSVRAERVEARGGFSGGASGRGPVRAAALPGLAAIALLGGCGALEPCGYRDLQGRYGLLCAVRGVSPSDQSPRDQQGFLVGNVAAETADAPIVVFAYRTRPNGVEVTQAAMLSGSGAYRLAVPAGSYHIAAFEDHDGDLRYDPTRERAALYHDGGRVLVRSGERVDRLNLQLRSDRPQRFEFDFTLPRSFDEACCDLPVDPHRPVGTRQ